jgi:hypothetical protein
MQFFSFSLVTGALKYQHAQTSVLTGRIRCAAGRADFLFGAVWSQQCMQCKGAMQNPFLLSGRIHSAGRAKSFPF